jgi:hypothetical protein
MANTLMLLRVDGCPTQDDDLSFPLKSWLSIIADTINSSIDAIELNINFLNQYISVDGFIVPSLTAVEIAAIAADLVNGVLLYDTTNNVYVGQQAGSLVKFTTSSYP